MGYYKDGFNNRLLDSLTDEEQKLICG